jgi:D-alanine-D-alanine ligase-like ATP-grasp enzyme/acylphosphatase
VRLIRYVGPGRAFRRSYGLVAGVAVSTSGGRVEGVGEATVVRSQMEAAWSGLEKLASGLIGTAVSHRVDVERPLKAIRGWSAPAYLDRAPRRAARLAIEAALLDLVWKLDAQRTGGSAPEGLPLRAGSDTSHQLPLVRPGAASDALSPALRDEPGTSWAARFVITGDDDIDLGWLRQILAIEGEADRERPIWLVGGGRSPTAAAAFVRRVAAEFGDALGPRRLLWEEPVAARRAARAVTGGATDLTDPKRVLPQLQLLADEVFPGAAGDGGRRLLIVAGDCVGHLRALRSLLGRGAIGGVHLVPGRWGTLTGLVAAAGAVKRADRSAIVVVSVPRGSRLSSASAARLASSTEDIDVFSVTAVAGWPTLLPAGDGSAAGSGNPGDARILDWDELAAVVDEVVTVPPAGRVTKTEPPNSYPGHPLLKAGLPARSLLLETEALRLGLCTRRFSPGLITAEHLGSGVSLGFSDSESSGTSVAAARAALHKGVTRALLASCGLPVAEGSYHPPRDVRGAHAAGIALGFPLVVKPGGGSKGTGVTTGIGTPDELAKALREVVASPFAGTGIVVERCATGNDHRILATRDEVISVVRRAPASVAGDGRHTVEELIVLTNAARRRNPHLSKRPIPLDRRVDDFLHRQGMSRHTVPRPGERVRVRAEANLHQGGDSYEVLDSTHPTILELAVDAVRAVPGLTQAGIDVLLDDHRLPVDAQPVTIIEINSRPVQTLHHFPMFGPPRNVSARLAREAAVAAGVSPPPAAEALGVRLDAYGRVQRVGYRRWMASVATELGLDGWVANASDPDRVTALIQGPADAVGLMVRLAFDGPAAADVVETRARPEDGASDRGFTIRHDAGGARDATR